VEKITIEVPPALAGELMMDGIAERANTWRGADVVSLLTLAVDSTSAVMAVVVSRTAIAEIARRFVQHRVKAAGPAPEVTILIKTRGGERVLVEVNDTGGRLRLAALVELAMDEASNDG
jgi:hypothetical protein